ncbi:hypothetical protein CROQUDRAFT_183584 [Cronartium quercuum f. sp. fusiforme G11]|uniref:Uncharacterized protein n=1 Tax=Cronartium quercuum f. sp. fusiforme G11 TaxID=708437 RepID=A0A9P6NCI8_9BASI|nr:hypothetical protein CROQUDRAFT_183584 [Cronartium quercuum f. sp. fusiforme G11]
MAQNTHTDTDQTEDEVVSQSLRSLTPSASTSNMNAPRRSSRLGTPRLSSVTTSASLVTADNDTPRSRRASARASTRPLSSNTSLKSPSSLRGLKNVSAESLTSLRSSPRLNSGGRETLNRTTTQAKRRKTTGTSSLISHSEMTDVLDLPEPSSTSLSHEAVDTPASQGLIASPATQDAISLPDSQAQELLVSSQHPVSLSDSHDPAPEPASSLLAQASSLAPAADQPSSVQALQEGRSLPTMALIASSTSPSISIPPDCLSIPQRSLQTSTSKKDTPISESQTDQLDASMSNSRVATPSFIPQEARPILDSREEHGALRIQTSKELTPTSESQTDQLEVLMPTSRSATPTSKSQETRPSLDLPENITAFSSAEQVASTSTLPDDAQLPNSNAPEPASTVKIVQQSPDSKAEVDIGSTHGQRSGDTVVIEVQPSHGVSGNVQVESNDPTHEKRPEVHAPEAGSSKPAAPKRAPRARRAPKWEPSTIPVEDDEDFFNLAPRTTVQFVSKTLGLRPGDRRSASATAPSSGVEAISPQRPPKVIHLSDDDEDSNPNPDVQHEIGSDEESEEESGVPSTRKSRKKKASHAKLPTWTQAKTCDAISLGSSSDEELNNGKKAFTLDLSSDDSDHHTDKKDHYACEHRESHKYFLFAISPSCRRRRELRHGRRFPFCHNRRA